MNASATNPLDTLRAELADYDRAEMGRLNATADALRSAATACGWSWGKGERLRQWVVNRLTGEDRPEIVA